jgi:hypothetical protein
MFGKKKNIKQVKNQAKEPELPKKEKKQPRRRINFSLSRLLPGRFLTSILDGTILTKEATLRLLPFAFFMTFLAILYIANTYYAEKTVRKIDAITREMKEIRYEKVTAKSRRMFYTKQSEIAKRLDTTGIKETTEPPVKIFVNEENK